MKRAPEIIGKLHEAGFSDENVTELAGGDKVVIDLGVALSRVRQLGASDWNLILGFEDYLVPKSVVSKWKSILNPYITKEIAEDLSGTRLEQFLGAK